MNIQILQTPPGTAKPLDVSRQRSSLSKRRQIPSDFVVTRTRGQKSYEYLTPHHASEMGQHSATPNPHEPPFHVRGMPAAPGLLIPPTFWHHLVYFCPFQPDYLSFPNCTKTHCPSSKGEPLDGGCLCYQNICPMQKQLNTTFQEAVLIFVFSPTRRSWGESRQTLWMHNCDCLSDT